MHVSEINSIAEIKNLATQSEELDLFMEVPCLQGQIVPCALMTDA